MLRLIFTLYLIVATFAGPHVCCMTARAASLLPTLPISRPEHHPCCPEESREEAVPPDTSRVPCEDGKSPGILFKIERDEVATVSLATPLFVADLPVPTVTESDLVLFTPTHLYGTDLLHVIQRLTC